jgi:hypothetical protein
VSLPYMSVLSEEDEITGNGGGHSMTHALPYILHVAKFRQSRSNITTDYRGRKLRSVCDRINELKKVPFQLVGD